MNTTNLRSNKALSIALLFGVVLGVGPVSAQFGPAPDLVAESLVLSPTEPEPGSAVELKATIINRGQGRVLVPFSVILELDGEILTHQRISSRPGSGQRVEVSALWTATEGEHRARVRVDVFNDIDESDESNNVLASTFEVRGLEGIRSFTLALFEALSRGLQEAGQALQLDPETTDLFQLVELFNAALRSTARAFTASAQELSTLRQGLPPKLAEEEQIQTGSSAAKLYHSLAEAFEQAEEALQRLNLQILLNAFEEIQTALVELSTISLEGISLSALSDTIPLMDQVLEETEQLQKALSGADVDANAVIQELIALLTQIGGEWVRVGEELVQSARQRAARFTDAQDRPIVSYRAGQELRVSAPGAQNLKWEVFDSSGELRFRSESEGERLIWKGVASDGKPLPPGRYFYRLTITEAAPRVELGRIVLSE
jgi:hypothetical protein